MKMGDTIYIDLETLKRLQDESGHNKEVIAAGAWQIMERGEEITIDGLKKEITRICAEYNWTEMATCCPKLAIFPAFAAARLIAQGKRIDPAIMQEQMLWRPESDAERTRFGSISSDAKFKYTKVRDGFHLTSEFP